MARGDGGVVTGGVSPCIFDVAKQATDSSEQIGHLARGHLTEVYRKLPLYKTSQNGFNTVWRWESFFYISDTSLHVRLENVEKQSKSSLHEGMLE